MTEIVWAVQRGAQEAFLTCPAFETLMEGNRGGGKTSALLMDFAQHVDKGYGADWRGIIFRKTYKQLDDVVSQSKQYFNRAWPLSSFNQADFKWTFPRGETLKLAYMERPDDYWNYHGHAYPFIGWEELTTWNSDECYRVMMSCCRSTNPKLPRKYRANTNPYGAGHNWVKSRFRLPAAPGRITGDVIHEDGLSRVAIHSSLRENTALMTADPGYLSRVLQGATNPAMRAAWEAGSWDIVAGGMFDDVWNPLIHVIPSIAPRAIPDGWRLDRSYDHGQSRPFSVGWWAQSDGTPLRLPDGRLVGGVRGDVIRLDEWYGWNGRPNEGLRMLAHEIAQGIRDRERGMGRSFRPGPADSSIFDDFEPGRSISGEMAKAGIKWDPADKRAGSRKQGWEMIRAYLKGALPGKEGVRERPGLFVCACCEQFRRTVPVLSRSDKDPDDVDTTAEDHIGDEVRYRLRGRQGGAGIGSF